MKIAIVTNWQSDTKLKEAETAFWNSTDIPNFADPSQDQLAEKRKLEKLEEQEQEEEEEEKEETEQEEGRDGVATATKKTRTTLFG